MKCEAHLFKINLYAGKNFAVSTLLFSTILIISCADPTSSKIKNSLSLYYYSNAKNNNQKIESLVMDSLSFMLADSTVYYYHILNSLDERSQSFSKMARLRTNIAKGHIDNFLSDDEKENYQREKNKIDVDKSLEILKQNEREWNIINDSMDLMLAAVHNTDTLKKPFYDVNYTLNLSTEKHPNETGWKEAILTKDFKVLFVQ